MGQDEKAPADEREKAGQMRAVGPHYISFEPPVRRVNPDQRGFR